MCLDSTRHWYLFLLAVSRAIEPIGFRDVIQSMDKLAHNHDIPPAFPNSSLSLADEALSNQWVTIQDGGFVLTSAGAAQLTELSGYVHKEAA